MLAEHIRQNCDYIITHDRFSDHDRMFWYEGGVYKPITDSILQGYIKGYAGRTLSRNEFAAALDTAMARGAKLDERIVKAFEPELSHVRVAHVEGNGNEEGKWYERPRFSYDKVEKHEIPMKHFRVQKNNNNK